MKHKFPIGTVFERYHGDSTQPTWAHGEIIALVTDAEGELSYHMEWRNSSHGPVDHDYEISQSDVIRNLSHPDSNTFFWRMKQSPQQLLKEWMEHYV